MNQCFVIQPFDQGVFDKRYREIFKSAIEKADLIPYRVDNDPSVNIVIKSIEEAIESSLICFADITMDNPNVWYELGYAFAKDKKVVIVCSDERGDHFPFDIGHRQIIKYQTKSPSDYQSLESKITEKLREFKRQEKLTESIAKSSIIEQQGLKAHEIALLVLIVENQLSELESVSTNRIKHEMNKSGFTDIAASIGLRALNRKGLIEFIQEVDNSYPSNEEYIACRTTTEGDNWILANQDHFLFYKSSTTEEDDELPF